MNTQLLEIQPRELKFVCEVKKQSSCVVHLVNLSDQYVAFKIKTTSPKKYCVRPNVGIIKPKSACDFTVTMQAQKSATSDMHCKDKFLIQSTVAPFGTTEDEIAPDMFAKDTQKYIEETKLRVVLATAPNSPAKSPSDVLLKPPSDAVLKHEASSYETVSPKESRSPVLPLVNGFSKQGQPYEMPKPKDAVKNRVEDPPHIDMAKKVETTKNETISEEPRSRHTMDDLKSVPMKPEVLIPEQHEESKNIKEAEEIKFNLTREIEELKSKISSMDTKLIEAQRIIEKLNREKSITINEKETLKQQLAMLRTTGSNVARKVYVGFPPLFVCMIALISLMLGLFFQV